MLKFSDVYIIFMSLCSYDSSLMSILYLYLFTIYDSSLMFILYLCLFTFMIVL